MSKRAALTYSVATVSERPNGLREILRVHVGGNEITSAM